MNTDLISPKANKLPQPKAAPTSVTVTFGGQVWKKLNSYLKLWESEVLDRRRASIGIAMTRILVGGIGFGLLATNFTTRLYSFGPGSAWNGEYGDPQSDLSALPILDIFRVASLNASLYTILYIALMVLSLLVMLGWRTRLSLLAFGALWVSFIEANDFLGDQGDNMYRIILILLLFTQCSSVLSLDARRRTKVGKSTRKVWGSEKRASLSELSNLLHNLAIVILACQVFFVYVAGGLYKAAGLPWQNGTALYAPLATERFGNWPWLSELLTSNASVVAVLTWSSILLQLAFPFMLLAVPTRRVALVGIWCFHIGIGVLMGLPWFSLTMIAVDFIFIRDTSWVTLKRRFEIASHYVRQRVSVS